MSAFKQSVPLLLLWLPMAAVAAVSPGVVSTQLSDIQQPDGDASGLVVSDNGATVCFVADRDTDEARELYCSDSDNPQTATRISGLLPAGTAATFVTLSSDGSMVYYLAPELNGSKVELFRAPADGSSAATRLNAPLLPPDGDVARFELLEGHQKVLYSAAAETDGVFELYVVDLATPGQADKLSGAVVASGSGVKQFRLDQSTDRAYYTSEQQTLDKVELYGNALTGGALVKLNAPINAGEFIGSFGFIPGGARIHYRVAPNSGPTNAWVASATQSGTAWQLNQTLQANGTATVVTASSDGSRLVFVADVTVDGRFGLYSRALDGSEPQPQTIDDAIIEYPPMTLSELPQVDYVDDGTVLYRDAYNVDGYGKLQTHADVGGGSPTTLSGALDVTGYRLALERGEAVMVHSDFGNGVINLAVVKLDASAILPLTNFNTNTGVSSFGSLDALRRYWVFQADPVVNDRRDVFALDIQTGVYQQRSGSGADLVAIEQLRRASVADVGWACFVEYRQNQMIPTIRSRLLRCTGENGAPGHDFAQIGTVQVGNAPTFNEVLPGPASFSRVFYIADEPTTDQFQAFQADFSAELFADGFED